MNSLLFFQLFCKLKIFWKTSGWEQLQGACCKEAMIDSLQKKIYSRFWVVKKWSNEGRKICQNHFSASCLVLWKKVT